MDLEDLPPRIKELKVRHDELSKARLLIEAEMAARGVQSVDVALAKTHAEDLHGRLILPGARYFYALL